MAAHVVSSSHAQWSERYVQSCLRRYLLKTERAAVLGLPRSVESLFGEKRGLRALLQERLSLIGVGVAGWAAGRVGVNIVSSF